MVQLACNCETVTLFWHNVYEPSLFEIVGSVGSGMPTSALNVADRSQQSVTREVLESGMVLNNEVSTKEK